jgi:hypothetical protein
MRLPNGSKMVTRSFAPTASSGWTSTPRAASALTNAASLFGGLERLVGPQVQLRRAALEPGAAAHGQVRRLDDFGQSQHAGIKVARDRLGAGWHRQLYVINARNLCHIQFLQVVLQNSPRDAIVRAGS